MKGNVGIIGNVIPFPRFIQCKTVLDTTYAFVYWVSSIRFTNKWCNSKIIGAGSFKWKTPNTIRGYEYRICSPDQKYIRIPRTNILFYEHNDVSMTKILWHWAKTRLVFAHEIYRTFFNWYLNTYKPMWNSIQTLKYKILWIIKIRQIVQNMYLS